MAVVAGVESTTASISPSLCSTENREIGRSGVVVAPISATNATIEVIGHPYDPRVLSVVCFPPISKPDYPDLNRSSGDPSRTGDHPLPTD
ncbi:hypothetical protein CRG98_006018 [Punica granatum]|uniref:Uncharacterized protein n=1 Tax=Punica granatum TaxID=22663 RepID=A0A2I0KZ21_PUNGR|nr:hypothetical protein CRG98_006018 [Punica granatum]